ncbi:MAG: polysaccharide biosynthesis/export family protein [Cyanobacteria bacterium J06621_3]
MVRISLPSTRYLYSWSALLSVGLIWCGPSYAQSGDLPVLPGSNSPAGNAVPAPPTAPAVPVPPVPTPNAGISRPAQGVAASVPTVFADASYVLGPGDRLDLSFFNVPEYDGERQVGIDGTLNLPLVGKVRVAGFTVEQATANISTAYAPYLRTPLVTINLLALRPIQVGISGEINKPGAYELALASSGTAGSAVQWPTLIDAIQLAGGITDKADIQQIEIRRPQISGSPQIIRLNLWDLLATGSIDSDITLRYGDAINIPTATALTPGELTQLSAANFSPDAIQVTVVGEVPQPGRLEITPNAPLNQAILAAGGFDPQRANTDQVELVRLNADGTVTQRAIPIAFDQGINDETNPALQDNDVILVGRSGRAAFGDDVSGVLGPFGTILSPLGLLFNIFD